MIKTLLYIFAVLALAAPAVAQHVNLDDVSFDQKLNAKIDTDATFTDDTGQTVRIGDLLQNRPTIVMLGFYECPMLCDPLLQNLALSLKKVELTAGKDFNVVTLSINPAETTELAAKKKAEFVKLYARPDGAAGWHCLTGNSAMIERFAASIGFKYATLPGGQFSHPAGVILVMPDGRVDRYLIGMTFQARDLRFGLIDASQGKLGTLNDAILLRCYHYDPATGRYGFEIQAALRISGCATALALFVSIAWLSIRYRQKPQGQVAS